MRNIAGLFTIVLFTLLLSACQSASSVSAGKQMNNLLLAEPAPINTRSEFAIARYNMILSNENTLNDDDRAELHFHRGMHYDSVGLSGLAQFDFSQALKLKPDMAAAYNSIGVHFTQSEEFLQAYEAFDSTLDIDPNYEYAFLNRGIALYYGDRAELAVSDLKRFYQYNQEDPFRALWAYFALNSVSSEEGLTFLMTSRKQIAQQHWAATLVDVFLGKANEYDVLNALTDGVTTQKELTDRLCEAYFYLGKYHALHNEGGVASNYFKLALSTNVFDYVEHRYARLELNRVRESVD